MLVDLPKGWAQDPAHPYAELYKDHGHPDPVRRGLGMYEDLAEWDIEHLVKDSYPFTSFLHDLAAEERIAAIESVYVCRVLELTAGNETEEVTAHGGAVTRP